MSPEEVTKLHAGILPPGVTLSSVTNSAGVLAPKANGRAPPAKRGKSERWQLLNTYVDVYARDLKDAEAKVWIALYRDAKGDSLARTGQTDLAKRCGVGLRTVQTAIARLKAKGFLELVRRGRINAGPSTYRVKVPD